MHRQPRLPYLVIALLLAGCAAPVAIPPSNPVFGLPASSLPTAHVGDIAVYRIRNAYNGEPLGETQYRVDKIDGGRVAVAVTTTPPSAGLPHTAVYTADGNWLRHPLRNHDQAIEYDFDPPLPAYALPLEAGCADCRGLVMAERLLVTSTPSHGRSGGIVKFDKLDNVVI